MASPTTLPTLEYLEGQVAVLLKGSTVLGQVVSVSPQSQSATRKLARLGDTDKVTSYGPAEHSLSIELYAERDPDQLAALLGGSTKPGSGGWVGTEILHLNPTITAYNLTLDIYDAATSGTDNKIGSWTFAGFKPSSLSAPFSADNVANVTMNGECSSISYTPVAGYGA